MDELFSSPDLSEFPLSLHLAMIQDRVRIEAYSNAMKSLIKPEDVIVDVGTGTGVLSFLAAGYGAGKIYAIDRSSIIDYASKIKNINAPNASIFFLKKDILTDELPNIQADIAICELFGNFGIDENVIKVLDKVRSNLLKPDGRIIPEKLQLIASPVQCTTAYREIAFWKSREYDIDFSPIQELAYNAVYQITGEPVRQLSAEQVLTSIDFATAEGSPNILNTTYSFTKDGVLHGLAGWFRLKLAPGHILDTGPESPETHWGQVLFPIGDPLEIKKGGCLSVEFKEKLGKNESQWYWSGTIQPRPQTNKCRKFSYCASRRFYDE